MMLDSGNSKRTSSNVFSLAVMVGFLVFLITYDLKDGRASVLGFFIGLTVTIGVHLIPVAGTLKSRTVGTESPGLPNSLMGFDRSILPENVSITREENESGVTIQIHVSKVNGVPHRKSQWTS
jgi:hypothetical protein